MKTVTVLSYLRGNKINQVRPRHHLFHLLQEHLLAGLLDVQIEIQSGLFHATYFIANNGFISTIQGELCRVSLTLIDQKSMRYNSPHYEAQ